MNPKCDLCGRKLTFEFEATCAWSYGLDETSVGGHWVCPATPDQHRIAELEKQVAELEAEIEARGPVAVTKRMTPEGERIAELERLLGEAKLTVYQREVRIETMDAENNRLWNQKNSALSERDEALTALREMAESATAERNACSEKQCEIGRLSAQLRAREADVLVLREALEDHGSHMCNCVLNTTAHPHPPCDCGLQEALSATAATAQEILERIEREAVMAFVERLMAQPYDGTPMCNAAGDRYDKLDILEAGGCAAIIGEKGKG